jgi:tetratricopeptide (TPR) repeat protein
MRRNVQFIAIPVATGARGTFAARRETLSAALSNHYALRRVAQCRRHSLSVARMREDMNAHARAFACAGLVVVLGAALSAGVAAAQTAEQRAWCNGQFDVTPKRRVDACTAVIDSGRIEGKSLSAALGNRGEAYADLRNVDRAIADFNEALRIVPKNSRALTDRGEAYLNLRNVDRAIEDFNDAVRIDPGNSKAFAGRGVAFQFKGGDDSSERAISDWTEALRIDPGNADVLENRARIYMIQRNYDGMIADYGALIRLDPQNDWAFQQRAYAYRHKGELDRALADYNQAIRIDPNNVQAVHGRGLVYQDKGELDRAISDYDAAIRIDPGHVGIAGVLRDRAAAYRAKGDVDRAVADEAEAKRRGW